MKGTHKGRYSRSRNKIVSVDKSQNSKYKTENSADLFPENQLFKEMSEQPLGKTNIQPKINNDPNNITHKNNMENKKFERDSWMQENALVLLSFLLFFIIGTWVFNIFFESASFTVLLTFLTGSFTFILGCLFNEKMKNS